MNDLTPLELIIKFINDIIRVTLYHLFKIGQHIIMMVLLIMTVITLSGNNIDFGEFTGFRVDDGLDNVSNLTQNPSQSRIADTGNIIENMYGHPVSPLNGVHYIAGSTSTGNGGGTIRIGQLFDFYYYGRDYVSPCGSDIYAPFDSTLTYQSDIGGGTPQLTFTSIDGNIKVHTMHLNAVQTSGQVSQGELVGYVDKKGEYSGGVCHGHDSIYVNGKLADIEYYNKKQG